MTEFELIERIFSTLQDEQPSAGIEKAIGDDAAVMSLPTGARLVSCIDTLVQGRHFSADWDEVNELAFTLPADVEPPASQLTNTQITCIGEVAATDSALQEPRPRLFYNGQAVTKEHPAPFTTLPSFTGYQHFIG